MEDPNLYVISNQLPRKDASELIPKYMKMLCFEENEEHLVLDVGCGSGDVTWDFLRPNLPKTTRILASDLEQNMLTYATINYPDISFFQLDINTKDLPTILKGLFHYVFSFHCLHWVITPKNALSNIYQLLKPGGFLFTYFMASHVFFDAFYNTSQLKKWKNFITNPEKHMPIFQNKMKVEESFHKILTDIGFKILVCKVLPREMCYTLEQLKPALAGVDPYLSLIPQELQEEFIDDTEKEFSKLLSYQEKHVKINYSIVLIIASKQP